MLNTSAAFLAFIVQFFFPSGRRIDNCSNNLRIVIDDLHNAIQRRYSRRTLAVSQPSVTKSIQTALPRNRRNFPDTFNANNSNRKVPAKWKFGTENGQLGSLGNISLTFRIKGMVQDHVGQFSNLSAKLLKKPFSADRLETCPTLDAR
jgi:hypothetical protein